MALGVCSPLQWRNRPRFSRGSLRLAVMKMDCQSIAFKERLMIIPGSWLCKEKVTMNRSAHLKI